MENLLSFFKSILGIGVEELSTLHILVRCLVVYILGIALVRLGNKRFIGKMSAFDIILAIIIGSLLSRSITEKDLFLEILAACLLLILMHRLFSLAAAQSDFFGNWIKGHSRLIVEDGEILWDAMNKSNLSKKDLLETLRLNAKITEVEKVKMARLERNGDISFILKGEK